MPDFQKNLLSDYHLPNLLTKNNLLSLIILTNLNLLYKDYTKNSKNEEKFSQNPHLRNEYRDKIFSLRNSSKFVIHLIKDDPDRKILN